MGEIWHKQQGETIKFGNDLVFGTNHRLGELVGTIGLKLRSGVQIFHKYTYFSLDPCEEAERVAHPWTDKLREQIIFFLDCGLILKKYRGFQQKYLTDQEYLFP